MENAIALNNPTYYHKTENKKWYYSILMHPWLRPYNRLAVLVVAINLALFNRTQNLEPDLVLNLVLVNFAVALIIRQQYVINGLFKIATSVPKTWPLSIRWAAAKVYHFGGIHVGGFFSGSLWLGYFTFLVVNGQATGSYRALFPLLIFHLLLLTVMMIAALPNIRARYHNQFEIISRFGTWTSLLIFWIQTLYLNPSLSPQVLILALVTFSVALPWLRLKKVPVEVVTPSNHVALASFDYGENPFAGSSTDLSFSPLFEWHAFANIPSPNKTGFRLAISRAGDWTGDFIKKRPKYVWVKGITTAGVGNVEACFKKVIWVATGSGVGPCIPHLLSQKVPSVLIWSTRDPEKTYGEDLVNEIKDVQPEAVIWNTQSQGKPDLVKLALEAYHKHGAEAVICISNKKTTFNLNYELESRGIPAFGAIWDS